MQRRSATTGLIVEASCVLHDMVGVLYVSERGAARSVASWRIRLARSRSELVIFPYSF